MHHTQFRMVWRSYTFAIRVCWLGNFLAHQMALRASADHEKRVPSKEGRQRCDQVMVKKLAWPWSPQRAGVVVGISQSKTALPKYLQGL